jgi:hypothetical protein
MPMCDGTDDEEDRDFTPADFDADIAAAARMTAGRQATHPDRPADRDEFAALDAGDAGPDVPAGWGMRYPTVAAIAARCLGPEHAAEAAHAFIRDYTRLARKDGSGAALRPGLVGLAARRLARRSGRLDHLQTHALETALLRALVHDGYTELRKNLRAARDTLDQVAKSLARIEARLSAPRRPLG